MDGIGKVDGCGANRQGDDRSLGTEDREFFLFEVGPQVRHELAGVRRIVAQANDAAEPRHVAAWQTVLVGPVGGHTPLGSGVHLNGADLELNHLALGANHCGVQRLVQVELGHGDEVFEPPLHRPPVRVDRTDGAITIAHRTADHPHTNEVIDVVELAAL